MTSDFQHFSPAAIKFLATLKRNNSRDWFHANKKQYEQALKQPAAQFCQTFANQLHLLTGVEHEHKIFRINRDVRFSKDKTPYNSHLRISFLPLTSSAIKPAWFFSLEPTQVIFGTGVFMLDKEQLISLRSCIDNEKGSALEKLLSTFSTNNIRLSEPELKRVPSPYPKTHSRGHLLRHKSLSAWIDFADPTMSCELDFLDKLNSGAKSLKPLYDWLQDI